MLIEIWLQSWNSESREIFQRLPTMWYILPSGIHRNEGVHRATAPACGSICVGRAYFDSGRPHQRPRARGPGAGTRGVRKARCSNPVRRKGKRGGFRYLFLHLEDRSHIHLLYLLDKDEQEDLSKDECKVLRAWVSEIKGSRGEQRIQ